mmetsp:Transcript_3963/g.10954  ORF Transcript_3963/g.10954 Transcript_3963/m.10954 type:complete len:206 (+) Transcript_3963:433-1050(+)
MSNPPGPASSLQSKSTKRSGHPGEVRPLRSIIFPEPCSPPSSADSPPPRFRTPGASPGRRGIPRATGRQALRPRRASPRSRRGFRAASRSPLPLPSSLPPPSLRCAATRGRSRSSERRRRSAPDPRGPIRRRRRTIRLSGSVRPPSRSDGMTPPRDGEGRLTRREGGTTRRGGGRRGRRGVTIRSRRPRFPSPSSSRPGTGSSPS